MFRVIKISSTSDELDDLIQGLNELTQDEMRRRMFLMQLQNRNPPEQAITRVGRRPDDPLVLKWIERDLTALLLHRQVGIMSQHCLGVLRSCSKKDSTLVERMAGEMEPFLGKEFSLLFSTELERFLMSRLTIKAHDHNIDNLRIEKEPQVEEQDRLGADEDCDFLLGGTGEVS